LLMYVGSEEIGERSVDMGAGFEKAGTGSTAFFIISKLPYCFTPIRRSEFF
jgi:hypothetical protein